MRGGGGRGRLYPRIEVLHEHASLGPKYSKKKNLKCLKQIRLENHYFLNGISLALALQQLTPNVVLSKFPF